MRAMKQGLIALLLFAVAQSASAFVVTGTLDLDPRNPELDDNFDINVSIDVTDNIADWTITFVSDQPTAFLGEFYFNIGDGTYAFSDFNPDSWQIVTPATEVGGGNWTNGFIYEANDTENGNGDHRVFAGESLTFTMTRTDGNFTVAQFLDAPCATTTAFDGCYQLGAHIQGFENLPPGSLFLVGNFNGGENGVPAPGTLALLGGALLALSATRRQR